MNKSTYIPVIFALLISSSLHSSDSLQEETRDSIDTIKIIFFETKPVNTEISGIRSTEYFKGTSLEIRHNYFIASSYETLEKYCEEYYPTKSEISSKAAYDSYPFVFSVESKYGSHTQEKLANLLIPIKGGDLNNSDSAITLIISDTLKDLADIPVEFDKKSRSFKSIEISKISPRYRNDVYRGFKRALKSNLMIPAYYWEDPSFEKDCRDLYNSNALLINELKRLQSFRYSGISINPIFRDVIGYFINIQGKMSNMTSKYSHSNRKLILSKSVSSMNGMRLPSPRKTSIVSDDDTSEDTSILSTENQLDLMLIKPLEGPNLITHKRNSLCERSFFKKGNSKRRFSLN